MKTPLHIHSSRRNTVSAPTRISPVHPLKNGHNHRPRAQKCLKRQDAAVNRTPLERMSRPVRVVHDALEYLRRARLQERARRQANLLNLTCDAIIVRTLQDRIVFWNSGAEALFGWNQSEAVGQQFCEWLRANDATLDAANTHLLDKDEWKGELKLRSKTGGEKTVVCHWNLLRDRNGNPEAIFSVQADITDRKKLETALLRMQRMDSLGMAVGGIMHDLNNCLVPVLASAELLKYSADDAERQRCIDTVFSNTRQATLLLRQILVFARGADAQTAMVSPQRIIEDIGKMMRNTFPKSIEIDVNPALNDLWRIEGVLMELYQVVLNLCVNARDAMPEGGRLAVSAANITLSAAGAKAVHTAPGRYVRLSVADTGAGIPADVLPRIFEPFFTTKSAETGTGLGLSTVASIIHHHHGAIDIKTGRGKGTEFSIYLPAGEPLPEPALIQPGLASTNRIQIKGL